MNKINQMLQDMLERIILEGTDPLSEVEITENEINSMLEWAGLTLLAFESHMLQALLYYMRWYK